MADPESGQEKAVTVKPAESLKRGAAPSKRESIFSTLRKGDTARTDGDVEEEEELEPKAEDVPPAPFYRLLSTADAWDVPLMLIGTIGAIGNGVLMPLFAIVFGEFTDALSGNASTSAFMSAVEDIALKFLYLAIAAVVGSYLEAGLWMYTGNRQANRLRTRFLHAVLHQDVAFFDVQSTTGGLVQGLNEDSIDVQNAISEKLGAFLHHTSTFLSGFIIGFVKGWEMALVMVGCIPFLALIGGLLSKGESMSNAAAAKAYAEASAIAQQSIAQIRTIAAYNREEAAKDLYDKALEGPRRMGIRQAWIAGASFGGVQFVIYGTYACGLFFGAYRVAAGAYTGGQVLSVLVATLMGGFSLGQAAPVIQYFAKGRAAGGRMFRVIDRKPAIDDEAPTPDDNGAANGNGHATNGHAANGHGANGHAKDAANGHGAAEGSEEKANGQVAVAIAVRPPPERVLGEVELRSVDFCYPSRPDVMIFSDFNLHVPAGKTVALVGSSGSGKSTVVQLVERFYDPAAGAVLLDGRDLRSLPLKWLRNQVGLVSQEPTLFATTIYENIAIGLPGCSAEEVEAAARAANAHAFIANLPLGYETQVGERGVQLSGGQKQRIAIARAILKGPKVMLLDEATSALDSRSEAIVQAALDRLVVGRTTLVVAHRLSTIRGADGIAVVQGGRVAELGTHEQLLKDENGVYSVLVKLQMEAQSVQAGADADAGGGDEGVPEEPETAAGLLVAGSGAAAAPVSLDGSHHARRAGSGPAPAPVSATAPGERPGSGHLSQELAARAGQQPPGGGAVALTMPHAVPSAPDAAAPGSRAALEKSSVAATHGSEPRMGAPQKGGKDKGGKEGKEGKKEKEKPYEVPFKRLLSYAKGEEASVVLGCLASVAAGAQHPAFAFVIANMITIFYTLTPSELKSKASFYSWMFFLIACCAFLSLLAQSVAFGRVAQVVSGRIRTQLFGAILRQEVAWFDEADHSSGKLTSSLATDATYVRGAVGDVFAVAFSNLSTLALGYMVAFAYDWRMALLVTGVFPFIVLSMAIHMKFAMGFSSDADKLYAGANQMVTEAFASIRVIHAYNLQGFVCGTYDKMIATANKRLVRQSNASGLAYGFSMFIMFGMYSLIIYFMGQEIVHGWVEFQDSFIAFMAVLLAAMGMAQASMAFPDLGKAKAAVQRVFPIIDRKPAIDSSAPDGAQPDPETLRGEIEFRAVRFAYPSRLSVVIFNNFSLTMEAGKVTALVGESGSGKSTVVGLIERFYDPLGGAVFLDDVDVRQYNLRFLRAQVGLVSQEPLLFNGTVADNIRIGLPNATDEEVAAAAEAANAKTFIEALPEAYNTRVGEGGIQLSGGQKQRVAIARAVIKNPKVMLLDEATSALDARSEAVVQAALDRIMLGRTSVVIAHRLSTIRNANTIAVVYRGAILEKGSHDELMALPNGSYARLVAAQNRGEVDNKKKKGGAKARGGSAKK